MPFFRKCRGRSLTQFVREFRRICGKLHRKKLLGRVPASQPGHAIRGRHRGEKLPCEIETLIGGADMRVKVTLACTECKQRNYNTKKNKKNDPDRLEMNKYCKFCRKHTLHKETK